MSVLLFQRQTMPTAWTLTATQKAFQLTHVFIMVVSISSISLVSAWMGAAYGETGTLISTVIIGFAEIHAAAFSISQLARPNQEVTEVARWGVVAILAASVLSKSVLSVVGGGKKYGLRMAGALVLFISITGLGLLL
jgi:uncharacterized membrane protein (DUF4010 family)